MFSVYDRRARRTRLLDGSGMLVSGCVRMRGKPPHEDLSEVSFLATNTLMARFVSDFNLSSIAHWIMADGRNPSPEFFFARFFESTLGATTVSYPPGALDVLKINSVGSRDRHGRQQASAFFHKIC